MHEILLDSPYYGKDFFNFEVTSRLPRHRWYYFKEGFSTSLVEEAIKHNAGKKKSLRVLDPFCGCGTTPLTSAINGHACTAVEVNPFLAFTATTKTMAGLWDSNQFGDILKSVSNSSSGGSYSHLEEYSTFTERDGLDKWLFNKSVLRQFIATMESIQSHGGVYSAALKLAAFAAAYACCNAKRDGKALRYKRDWKEVQYSGENFNRHFQNHALMMLDDVEKYPIQNQLQPNIIVGDSRIVIDKIEDADFDLVITSPPYLNSSDYSDVYRPELFLGNYVRDNIALRKIRLQTLRSHVQIKWPSSTTFESAILTPIVEKLNANEDLWNRQIPIMVKAYFDDLSIVLHSVKARLNVDGQVWMVVSTSAYGGIHIPVDLILADAATMAGFDLVAIHCLRHLRTAGQQWKQLNNKKPPLRESLVIMKKS